MSFFSKFKIGSTSYDVKDALAGKSLALSDNTLQLKDASGTVRSTVTLPLSESIHIHRLDPIRYTNNRYEFYAPTNPSIKDKDIVIFENNVNTAYVIAIDMMSTASTRYIELVDSYTETVYRLYNKGQQVDTQTNFGKLKAINTNSIIVTKAIFASNMINFEIIDIIPIYDGTTFTLFNDDVSMPATTDNLAGNKNFNHYSYLYTYITPTNIKIFDGNSNDITNDSTLWMAVGITTKGLYDASLYIHTTTNIRIKKLQCNVQYYGIPKQYMGSSGAYAMIGSTGYFDHISSTTRLGQNIEQFEITNYSYLANTDKGMNHVIKFTL